MTLRFLFGCLLLGLLFSLVAVGTMNGLSRMGWLRQQRTALSSEQNTSLSHTAVSIVPSSTPLPPKKILLIFLGDMMFDRHIRLNSQKRGGYTGTISPGLQTLFSTADLVIGNLEGPVTDNPSKSLGSKVGSPANYLFTFDPVVIHFLHESNIRLVNLGNNHILNFGQEGLEKTYQLLEHGQIGYFGATGRSSPYQRWYETVIDGVSFAFVNYNQFTPEGFTQALEDLAVVRPSHDVVILYTHWGNEYVPENATLKEQAAAFVEAGADLIIGSHPHVVTGTEEIMGKKVYYSLGNFIFDQYFEPAVQQGLVVRTEYDPLTQTFMFTDIPVKLEPNGITSLITE